MGWLGDVETEPQGREPQSRVGYTVRAMAGGGSVQEWPLSITLIVFTYILKY